LSDHVLEPIARGDSADLFYMQCLSFHGRRRVMS